jgi:hypothetical protein
MGMFDDRPSLIIDFRLSIVDVFKQPSYSPLPIAVCDLVRVTDCLLWQINGSLLITVNFVTSSKKAYKQIDMQAGILQIEV